MSSGGSGPRSSPPNPIVPWVTGATPPMARKQVDLPSRCWGSISSSACRRHPVVLLHPRRASAPPAPQASATGQASAGSALAPPPWPARQQAGHARQRTRNPSRTRYSRSASRRAPDHDQYAGVDGNSAHGRQRAQAVEPAQRWRSADGAHRAADAADHGRDEHVQALLGSEGGRAVDLVDVDDEAAGDGGQAEDGGTPSRRPPPGPRRPAPRRCRGLRAGRARSAQRGDGHGDQARVARVTPPGNTSHAAAAGPQASTLREQRPSSGWPWGSRWRRSGWQQAAWPPTRTRGW